MTDQQLREIAIRLAEVSAVLIKSKQGRYKRLTVTFAANDTDEIEALR